MASAILSAAAWPRRIGSVRAVHSGDGIAVAAAASRSSGFGQLRAEGAHSDSSKRSAVEAASSSSKAAGEAGSTPSQTASSFSSSSDKEAASEDGRAPAEPAADQAAPLLSRIASRATALWVAVAVLPETYVAPAVGFILSCAAAGCQRMAAPLAALLLLVPCLWTAYAEWNASRLTHLLEVKLCRKRAATQQAPTPVHRQPLAKLCHRQCQWMRAATQQAPTPDLQLYAEMCLEMAEQRSQYQQRGMRLGEYERIVRMVFIAFVALYWAAQLIKAASPILPFLSCFGGEVTIPVFGCRINILSLMTEWPLATFWAVYLQPIVTEIFELLEAHDKFFTAKAKRRVAHPVRPRRKP